MSKPSIARIIAVTIGLSALGGLAGGLLAAALLALAAVRVGDFGHVLAVLPWGALFGAAMGLILAPIAAWTLMTRVPIWRAVSESALGTVLGAGVGLAFQPMHDVAWLSPVYLGVVGFGLAGLRLRLAAPRDAEATSHAQAPANER